MASRDRRPDPQLENAADTYNSFGNIKMLRDVSHVPVFVAEPSSELRVCARNLQTVSVIVKLTYFSQIVSKHSSNFFAVYVSHVPVSFYRCSTMAR